MILKNKVSGKALRKPGAVYLMMYSLLKKYMPKLAA
jgi:hypothetical protein